VLGPAAFSFKIAAHLMESRGYAATVVCGGLSSCLRSAGSTTKFREYY